MYKLILNGETIETYPDNAPSGGPFSSPLSEIPNAEREARGIFWEADPIIEPEEDSVILKMIRLGNAYNRYQEMRINAAGLVLANRGIDNNLPKCLAVQAWVINLYSIFRQKEAVLLSTGVLDLDFSASGPLPYSIDEIMVEVGIPGGQ